MLLTFLLPQKKKKSASSEAFRKSDSSIKKFQGKKTNKIIALRAQTETLIRDNIYRSR